MHLRAQGQRGPLGRQPQQHALPNLPNRRDYADVPRSDDGEEEEDQEGGEGMRYL